MNEESVSLMDVLMENQLLLSCLLNHMHQDTWFCPDCSSLRSEIEKLRNLNSEAMDKLNAG